MNVWVEAKVLRRATDDELARELRARGYEVNYPPNKHYRAWKRLSDRCAHHVVVWLWCGLADGDLIAKFVLRWHRADQRAQEALK